MSKLYRTTSWRRILALALVFIMTLSILGSSGYTVFAEDLFGDDAPAAEEVVTAEPEEADTEAVSEAVRSEEAAPPEEEAEPAETPDRSRPKRM